MRRSSLYFCLRVRSLSQYSRAAAGSWIEQGPMTTKSRCFASVPVTTSTASLRPFRTVSLDLADWGISCWRRSGGVRGLYPRTVNDFSFACEAWVIGSSYCASPRCRSCFPHWDSLCSNSRNESEKVLLVFIN